MIRHHCPVCGEVQDHSPDTAGMTLPCKHCRSLIEVPAGSTTTARTSVERLAAEGSASRPLVDILGGWFGAHTAKEPPPAMNTGKRVMYALLGLFLLLLFGGVGAYGAYSFVEKARSQRWLSTDGQVVWSSVAEKVSRDSRGRRHTEYSATVRYEFLVGAQKHEGARIAFGDGQTYSFLARALASQYPRGQKVTVYYDPADPKSAVLRREVLFGGYVLTAVGVFVGFIGLRLILAALTPTLASSNSGWLPWSRRFTWVDLPLLALGTVGLLLWVPMLFGL